MRFVIFDIDGTLTNTKQVDDKCYVKAFESAFGFSIEDTNWEKLQNVTDWGITEELYQQHTGRYPDEDEYQSMTKRFLQYLQEERRRDHRQFSEVPGAKAFFDRLREGSGIVLGIATGSWSPSARIKLNAIGIHTSGVAFANSDHHKTRKEITNHAIKLLIDQTESAPERILYFGDGVWDFKTCQQLGIEFVGIDVRGDGRLKKMGAKNVFSHYLDPDEILKIITR